MTRKQRTHGQALTEYAIIISLCAVGLLLVVTIFGNDIREIYFTSSASLRQGHARNMAYADAVDRRHHLGQLAGGVDQEAAQSADGPKADAEAAEQSKENPYKWNASAQRWYDPLTNLFVSFELVSEYVEDPYVYAD